MSMEAVRRAVMSATESAVNGGSPDVDAIEWPNHKLGKQPIEGRWMRITLQTGQTTPSSIGGAGARRSLTPFVLIFQVFLPENSGTKKAYEIARALSAGAQGLDYRTVTYTDTSITPNVRCNASFETLGIAPIGLNSGFFQFNLTINGRAFCVDA